MFARQRINSSSTTKITSRSRRSDLVASGRQWPNLPQAKQFPGLDGRSAAERLKRYWRSRWPRTQAENLGNSPSRLSGGSRLQSFLSYFFGASHLPPVIFIFCELVLWIFFYLKSKRLFTFNGSNLHLIINFTMLIWNFPWNCIHYSVSIVCFVQSAFCCTF